jgi:very-short-patch-repair endonuclease
MTYLNNRSHQRDFRRKLRTHGTSAEAALWRLLQRRQVDGRRFRRQHGFGPYVLDFYCPAERLVVEIDGAVHGAPAQGEHDMTRDAFLRTRGLTVLRFENRLVFERPDYILAAIRSHLSPRGRPEEEYMPPGSASCRS